ncbi:MAG: excinuclease ABC subunit UvrC [Calditerrivibrio sp.]|nr:excinuclease ABC subunit UvrC [Calditerrivibrio sp.]
MELINLDEIPESPGVYTFLDTSDRIIYVGKAVNLRKRVASYFSNTIKSPKTIQMVSTAKDLKFIVTKNEVEALLLENNIIKTEKPKYNVRLKDAKSYPFIKLTKEKYPKITITRDTKDKDAFYYGPFVSASDIRGVLLELLKLFPVRTCSETTFKKGKICLNYQIKQCSGPCEGLISDEHYNRIVDDLKTFFSGKVVDIKERLKEKMLQYSQNLMFEDAAKIRDKIKALDTLFEKQSVVELSDKNFDLFILEEDDLFLILCSVFIRNGKIIGIKVDFIDFEDDFDISSYILQYYSITQQVPDEIAIYINRSPVLENNALLEAIKEATGMQTSLKKYVSKNIIDLSLENIKQQKEHILKKKDTLFAALTKLKQLINITTPIEQLTIECIDISHLYGNNTVGASICWCHGDFIKKRYRRYKIKQALNNDFESIYEVMMRKAKNIIEGNEEGADIYLIDGGPGQLNAALKALKENGLQIPILAISKGRSKRGLRFSSDESIEQLHIPNRKNPISFKKNDPLLLLLQKIRDEAHRFVISYMRSSYEKLLFRSDILSIKGIGEKRLKKILSLYPDIKEIKHIPVTTLSKTCGIPIDVAQKLMEHIDKAIKNKEDNNDT